PAYHSKLGNIDCEVACGCAILPLATKFRGPAQLLQPGQDDIVAEALYFFRANVLFRNFEIKGAADRTLIYLTFYTQQCLKELEKIPDKAQGEYALEV
ncbi:unnamed protein product, partial [Choristocarpus tenellus]